MMMLAQRVATTGWKRRTATMKPLSAPIAAPMARQIGMTTNGEVRPFGSRLATMTMLTRVSSGPIDMSIPPPPDRIAGVLAIAAMASGANEASTAAQLPKARKAGCRAVLTTSRSSVSRPAKAYGREPSSARKDRGEVREAKVVGVVGVVMRHHP